MILCLPLSARWTRRVLAVLLATVLLSQDGYAQIVEILLKDGSSVKGELLSFRDQEYRLRIDGAEQKIAESQVLNVTLLAGGTLIEPIPSDRIPPVDASTALEQIRMAMAQGNVEQAAALVNAHLQDYAKKFQKTQDEVRQLILDVHTEYLKRLVQARSAAHIASELMAIIAMLPAEDAVKLYDLAFDGLKNLSDEERMAPAGIQWMLAMAQLCHDQPMLRSRSRAAAQLMLDSGLRLLQNGQDEPAMALLEQVPAIDATLSEAVRRPLMEVHVRRAQQEQKSGHLDKALTEIAQALKLDQRNESVLAMEQDLVYQKLVKDLEGLADPYAQKQKIEEVLPQFSRPEYKAKAEQKLAEIKSSITTSVGHGFQDLKKYFPVKEGMWHRYLSGDGSTTETLRVDSVSPDEGVIKVYMTHEKTYKSYVTSQTFQIEIDQNHVYKNSRSDILLKWPVQVGDSWQWKDGSGTFRRTYRSTAASVTTQAGTFENCLVVEFTSTALFPDQQSVTITSQSYYAPDVGLVKLELVTPEYNQKYSMELIGYGVEKP